ncbi:hypothetical protein [Labrys neptuniae]
MTWYLLLTAVIGAVGAFTRQSWIVPALAGIVLLPVGIVALVLAGDSGWAAAGQTFVGLIVMQLVYVLLGWVLGLRRKRAHPVAEHDKPPL